MPLDEILNSDNKEQNTEIQPNEVYQFTFTKEELNEIYRLQIKSICKKAIIFTFICIFMIVLSVAFSAPDPIIGFISGIFFIGIVSNIKLISTYCKAWEGRCERISISTYEYKLFENYMELTISRQNEIVRMSKCYYTDIQQIQQLGKWLFLQFGGQFFIIRKSDLNENSAFYSLMYKKPSQIIEPSIPKTIPNKWRAISIILFVASLLSIIGALVLVAAATNVNEPNPNQNMWLCFLLTPIPITSIIFGYFLKSKGYQYKKNIIVGVIMTFLLCIYGSFTFIFH